MLSAALCTTLLLVGAVADEPKFKQAKTLYTELEYEKALERFQGMAAESRPASERGLLHMWSGLCLAGIGDMDQAEKAFAKALELDASLMLPVTASPKVSKMFASLKDKASAKSSGTTTAVGASTPDHRSGTATTASSTSTAPGTTTASAGTTSAGADTPTSRGWSVLFIGGSSAAALGAAAVLGGAVLSGLAFADLGSALDRSQFQDQAQASINSANTWMTGASVCYGVGGALFVVGAALTGVDVMTGD